MPRTDGLRSDLTKDHDSDCGADDGHQARGEAVQQDRKGGVDQHVAQQDTAEQEVTVITHWLDFGGVFTFLVCARIF